LNYSSPLRDELNREEGRSAYFFYIKIKKAFLVSLQPVTGESEALIASASSIYPIGIGARVEWKKESCPYLLLQPLPPPDMKECPIILRGLVCPFSSGLGKADQRKDSYTAWC
jgi:hypothetical protein